MAPQEELARLISEKGRKILVAENPVDLKSLQGENFVYLLQLPEGSTAAGGRAGGFGERRVERLYAFHYSNGSCRKLFEVDSPAAGMQVLLPDGTERIISGVVDPEFVASYKQIA